jgi:hypothetical protein
MIKRILLGIFIVGLLAAAVVVYLMVTLDPEVLGQKLIQQINQQGGLQIQAESFQISPFQGLYIENAHVEGKLASGDVTSDIARVVVDYQLLPILKGEVIVDQIVVEQPELVVVSSSSKTRSGASGGKKRSKEPSDPTAADPAVPHEPSSAPPVTISEFRVENASIISRIEGPTPSETTITGLDLQLDDFYLDSSVVDPLLGLTADGSIQIEQISADNLAIQGSRGKISAQRGRVLITDFGVDTDNASLEISSLDLDLRKQPPPFAMQAGGDYDLNSFVQEGAEKTFGPASLQLNLSGSGSALDQVAGDGTLRLERGTIPAFPMVSLIEQLLGERLITGSPYQATDIQFTVADERMQVEPFVLPLENMQISGFGTIEFAGPLDLELAVRLPRDQVNVDSLEGAIDGLTEDGWTTLPFNVEGTVGEPDVDIDSSLYKDAAVGMGMKAIGSFLDKVLDKDDSN